MAAAPLEVMERVAARRLDVAGWRRHALLRREGLSASSTLVWKPCQESLSPYLPFTMVTYGDRPVYVCADGEVFTKLTEASPGN